MLDPTHFEINSNTDKSLIDQLITKKNNYTSLKIENCQLPITDFQKLFSNSPNLKNLQLVSCPKIKYSIWDCLTDNSQLEEISLQEIPEMEYIGWQASTLYAKKTYFLPNLRMLKLTNCKSLIQICISAPKLKVLELSGNVLLETLEINTHGLEVLKIDTCKVFTKLNSTDSAYLDKIKHIFDASLYSLNSINLNNILVDVDCAAIIEKCPILLKLEFWPSLLNDKDFKYCHAFKNCINIISKHYANFDSVKRHEFLNETMQRLNYFKKTVLALQKSKNFDKENKVKEAANLALKYLERIEASDNAFSLDKSIEILRREIVDYSSQDSLKIREAAAKKLGLYFGQTKRPHESEIIVDSLLIALDDIHGEVRQAAANALSHVGNSFSYYIEIFSNFLNEVKLNEEDRQIPDMYAVQKLRNIFQSLTPPDKSAKMSKTTNWLFEEGKIGDFLSILIPEGVLLGKVSDNEDSFFDALAQTLNNINDTNIHTVKSLRTLCHEFYLNNKELVDDWNKTNLADRGISNNEYYFIQYSVSECKKIFNNRSPILGTPNVEGLIICRQLALDAICIVKFDSASMITENKIGSSNHKITKDNITVSFNLITKNDCRKINKVEFQEWLQKYKIPILLVDSNSNCCIPLLGIKPKAEIEHVQRSVPFEIKGLIYHKLPDDRNSLFHAVGLYINQDQSYLRKIVADHLEHNKNYFSEYIQLPKGQTIASYIQAVREGNLWEDNIVIEILIKLLDRPIIIIGLYNTIINRSILERRLKGEPIFVSYDEIGHYDAFLREEGVSSQDIITSLTQDNEHSQKIQRLEKPSLVSTTSTSETTQKITINDIICKKLTEITNKTWQIAYSNQYYFLVDKDKAKIKSIKDAFQRKDINIIFDLKKSKETRIVIRFNNIDLKKVELLSSVIKNPNMLTPAPINNTSTSIPSSNFGVPNKKNIKIDFDSLLMIWAQWWVKQSNIRLVWIDYSGRKAEEFKNTKNFISKIFDNDTKDYERIYGKKLALNVLARNQEKKSKKSQIVSIISGATNINYKKLTVNPQITSDITLMTGGELPINGSFQGIEASIKISESIAVAKNLNPKVVLKENEFSFKSIIPQNHDLFIEEYYTELTYNQPIKITGSVVISCSNKINPGIKYTSDGHRYTKWAIPISIIFGDLKKLDITNIIDDATDILEILDMFKIDNDDVILNFKITEKNVDTYTATPKLREEVKSQFDEQINKLKVSYQNYNKNIRIKRLFGGQLTVDNCSELLLEEEMSETKKQEPKILPNESKKGTVVSQVGQAENNAKPLKINDILNNMKGSKEYRALICGEPGVGKTTLLHQINYNYYLNTEEQRNYPFEWIFQIPLKNINSYQYTENNSICSLENIITQECFPEEIFQEIRFLKQVKLLDDSSLWEKKLGEILKEGKALVILDGMDEVSHQPSLKKMLSEIKYLPYIIITTRPYGLAELLNTVKFNMHIKIKGFSEEHIRTYIINYFKDKRDQPIDFEQNIINFLNEKNVIDLCRVPSTLEMVCFMLGGYSSYVSTSILDRIRDNFYNQLLESLCRKYLNNFMSIQELIDRDEGREYDPLRLSPDVIFELCKFELGFLENFAFEAFKSDGVILQNGLKTEKYLNNIDNNLKESILLPKSLLNFGILKKTEMLEAPHKSLFYFNHVIFMQYFAARYFSHCLQNKHNPFKRDKISSFPHKWLEEVDIDAYIQAQSKNTLYQQVWDFIKNILIFNDDQITAEKFNHLIDNVFFKPNTLVHLKEKITNLPQGYVFSLTRENLNQIKVVCLKYGVKKAQTLISLYNTLEILIKDNTLEDIVKLELDDEKYELLIISQNSSVINAIAQQLKIASGQLLSQLSLTHSFFSGIKSISNKTDFPSEDDKANLISCPIQ